MKNYLIDFEDNAKGEKSFGKGSFNKLVQTGTVVNRKPTLLVYGVGSDISDKENLQKRSQKKYITQKLVTSLITVAKEKGDEEMETTLKNAYHCLDEIVISNGRMHGEYCKSRFCIVCNGIRKATMINKLLPIIENWDEAYFVTLTVKSCSASHLAKRMEKMIQGFQILKERLKKRHQRGKGPKLIGVKSLECNFNPARRTYNPHFHLLVPSKELAILLIEEWLKLWTPNFTHRAGQHFRKVEDVERDLIETIKYGSKIFTEPDPRNKKIKTSYKLYIAAMYNIYKAMRGLRLFERFGFNAAGGNKKDKNYTLLENFEELVFNPAVSNWVNEDTGKTLSGFVPDTELLNLLENGIENKLE